MSISLGCRVPFAAPGEARSKRSGSVSTPTECPNYEFPAPADQYPTPAALVLDSQRSLDEAKRNPGISTRATSGFHFISTGLRWLNAIEHYSCGQSGLGQFTVIVLHATACPSGDI
jgi:hypothetical protein